MEVVNMVVKSVNEEDDDGGDNNLTEENDRMVVLIVIMIRVMKKHRNLTERSV